MAYLVLARKYRPKTFEDVVGQEHVTRTLGNAFEQNRVHHAFLLCGPRGVGKTTLARILGKALNCANGPSATPCGVCEACESIANGSAVDYRELDGASNRGIDAIRELSDAVRYGPAMFRKKVYVIDEVHMLTNEAFNALLKTLEEPPPHVTFVLATTEPQKIPNTILSRCQRYDFKLVGTPRLVEHMRGIFEKEGIAAEPAALALIARESGGSVRDALSLCDQVISYAGQAPLTEALVAEVLGVADRAFTHKLLGALAQSDAKTALGLVEEGTTRGLDEAQIAKAILQALHDLVVVQEVPGAVSYVSESDDEATMLTELAAGFAKGRLRVMFERMVKVATDMAEFADARLLLDVALIDLAAAEPLSTLADILAELQKGSDFAGGGGGSGSAEIAPTRARNASSTVPGHNRPSSGPSEALPQANPGNTSTSQVIGQVTGKATGVDSGNTTSSHAETSSPQSVASQSPKPEAKNVSPPVSPPSQSASASVLAPPSIQHLQAIGTNSNHDRVNPSNPLAAWADVITELENARELSLASLYQNAKVLSWADGSVMVGFAKGAMTGEMASEPDKVAAIKKFLLAYVGPNVNFSVRLLDDKEIASQPSAMSILEAQHLAQEQEREARVSEAEKHPMTKLVLESFGATIKEIKTDV